MSAVGEWERRGCPNCQGHGRVRDSMTIHPVTCGRCDGRGWIPEALPVGERERLTQIDALLAETPDSDAEGWINLVPVENLRFVRSHLTALEEALREARGIALDACGFRDSAERFDAIEEVCRAVLAEEKG